MKFPAGTDLGDVLQSCTGGWVIVSVTASVLLGKAVLVARTATALAAGIAAGAL